MLELKNLAKEIPRPQGDPFKIFQNVNCSLRDGEFVSVVGPSGCGKTTMAVGSTKQTVEVMEGKLTRALNPEALQYR